MLYLFGKPLELVIFDGAPEHIFLRAGIPSSHIIRSIADLPKLI